MNLISSVSAADDVGSLKEVSVREATRLDWVFAVANQSRVDPPTEWLEGYDSTKQRYELFVPPTAKTASKAKKGKAASNDGLPLVLFISAGDQPAGWSQLQAVCQKKGIRLMILDDLVQMATELGDAASASRYESLREEIKTTLQLNVH